MLLLCIHIRLLEIFGCPSDKPFAGLTVILIGDLLQMPPVKQRPIYALYNNAWQDAVHLWKHFSFVELDEVMRQQGDTQFINLLNIVRIADISIENESLIKSRFIEQSNPNYPHGALHIFAENAPAHAHNKQMLDRLTSHCVQIEAIDELPKDVSSARIDARRNAKQSETGGLARILEIKLNARVMLTANIDILDRLINGLLGTVKHIASHNGNVKKIYLKLDDSKAGLHAMSGDVLASSRQWVPISRTEAKISINAGSNRKGSVIRRTQFPLMLSYACTVHKVQGLSLENVVVSFNLERQKTFNYGQMYVALSRATSLNGLFLLGSLKKNAIKADPRAIQEYDRLRQEASIKPVCSVLTDDSLTVTLLNTRSLIKHAIDIALDKSITDTDLLCLTETQLTSTHDLEDISRILSKFPSILHNICNADKFQSISICASSAIEVLEQQRFTGFFLVSISKPTLTNCPIRLLVLYRKNSSSIQWFLHQLSCYISSGNIHLILGDFNVNALLNNNNIENFLGNYTQLVHQPTHLEGSALDHIYVRKDFLSKFLFKVVVKCTYFSDHDAVKLNLIEKKGNQ